MRAVIKVDNVCERCGNEEEFEEVERNGPWVTMRCFTEGVLVFQSITDLYRQIGMEV